MRALVVAAHGSRVKKANEDLYRVTDFLKSHSDCRLVIPCFLELADPDIQTAIELAIRQGATELVLVPYFLLPGGHVQNDLPRLLAEAQIRHPHCKMVLAGPIGYDPALAEVLCERLAGLNPAE